MSMGVGSGGHAYQRYLEHAIARNQAKCTCRQAAQNNKKSVTREAKQNPKAFKCVYRCMLRP